jgi:hypothetical protein
MPRKRRRLRQRYVLKVAAIVLIRVFMVYAVHLPPDGVLV